MAAYRRSVYSLTNFSTILHLPTVSDVYLKTTLTLIPHSIHLKSFLLHFYYPAFNLISCTVHHIVRYGWAYAKYTQKRKRKWKNIQVENIITSESRNSKSDSRQLMFARNKYNNSHYKMCQHGYIVVMVVVVVLYGIYVSSRSCFLFVFFSLPQLLVFSIFFFFCYCCCFCCNSFANNTRGGFITNAQHHEQLNA